MIASTILSRASFFYSIAAPMITNNAFLAINVLNAPQASLPLPSTDERNAETRTASTLVRKNTSMGLSFADCIALASVEALEFAGGPKIKIRLGRRDATQADDKKRRNVLRKETERSVVDTTLPSAALDSDGLRLYFGSLGLSEQEMVALCGAHDLGRHVTLLNMSKSCVKNLTRECLENAPVLMPFVSEEPDRFSNTYFKKLLKWNERNIELGEVAFIPTDVALVVDEGLRRNVEYFARDEDAFFKNFESALLKIIDVGTTSVERY
ncbi:hypothetical protein ACHAWO_011689 [Cyclotella atomus]|uniref:Plant heme peroxidase family profile domain-containing protein n=1 Tax=Cyclotella atomus TaxID=382360 RepID=A0ABD3PPC9_9STRA